MLFFRSTLNQEQEISRAFSVAWWQYQQMECSLFQSFLVLLSSGGEYKQQVGIILDSRLLHMGTCVHVPVWIKHLFGFMGKKWQSYQCQISEGCEGCGPGLLLQIHPANAVLSLRWASSESSLTARNWSQDERLLHPLHHCFQPFESSVTWNFSLMACLFVSQWSQELHKYSAV